MSGILLPRSRMGFVANYANAVKTANQAFWPDYAFSRELALSRGGDGLVRDIDSECGYDTHPNLQFYHNLYAHGGIASRVVNIWPDECWAAFPELYETEAKRKTKFERAWNRLCEQVLPWHFLHRVDRLSGIGHFAVLLLGIDDGRDLSQPVAGVDPYTGRPDGDRSPRELLYIRVFDETLVEISRTDDNPSSPRYGQPSEYTVQFANPSAGPGAQINKVFEGKVHWTRVIHAADNRHSSEVYGVPRVQPVRHYLHDIKKVCGGSGEMFWRGGFPGYAFEVNPDFMVDDEAQLKADISQEVREYTNGLRRYLTAMGGSWKSLSPQVADPTGHLTQYVNLLCATIGVPVPIFLGQQLGHLASNQNASAWKERLRGRQMNYLEPFLVRPFVNRLMDLGVLPRVDSYIINWRDLKALSDLDRANVALKQVQALMQYVTGDVRQVFPQRLMLTLLLGLTEAQADAVEEELRKNPPPDPIEQQMKLMTAKAKTQGGGRDQNSGSSGGRPAGGPPDAADG